MPTILVKQNMLCNSFLGVGMVATFPMGLAPPGLIRAEVRASGAHQEANTCL